jgi:hypothetical protein
MTFDLGRILSRSFSISWRHRWLWLLGVFGGAGVGGNFSAGNGGRGGGSGRNAQVNQFLGDHIGLILLAILLLVVIVLIALVISCIAVPASIWAGLQLDSGHDVGLRMAWHEGRRRFWRYLRLTLLKGLIALGLILVALVVVLLGVGIYAVGGTATIPILVLGGILLFLAVIVALVLLAFGLLWSDRMLVILDLGAVDSIRAGWSLVRREKLNSFLFSVVFGVIKFAVSLGIILAAIVVAIPGLAMVAIYFSATGGPLLLAIIGFAWLVVFGLGALLIGGGYLGALNQVGYAIAARDLAIGNGMPVRPEMIGWDPYQAAPVQAT